ncbi:MAG: hypothetical protein KGN36_16555 [Acidobacteriota bacterium]|nr:hypothetical protein [Acidobacteriota bacterium]
MGTTIAACDNTKTLPAAFAKLKKYAEDHEFKLEKTQADILKMMSECSQRKYKPDVKFEDLGKSISCSVGKSSKKTATVAVKDESAKPNPAFQAAIARTAALVEDVGAKARAQMENMAKVATNYGHFINVGVEGVNALWVVVEEMRKNGNASPTLAGFKSNPHVAEFLKQIQDCEHKAQEILSAQWPPLESQARQFQNLIRAVEAEADKVAAIAGADAVKHLKSDLDALAFEVKASIETDAPPPGAVRFIRLADSTTVADLGNLVTMDFHTQISDYEKRVKDGTEKSRARGAQHTGDALKTLKSMA